MCRLRSAKNSVSSENFRSSISRTQRPEVAARVLDTVRPARHVVLVELQDVNQRRGRQRSSQEPYRLVPGVLRGADRAS